MKVLAFDSSSQALSVALLDNQNIVAQTNLDMKQNHSVTLMPTIDFLMTLVGWQPSDLERVVVAQGPGSYTGLRMAVATAKTLAYALQIDVVGLSSLLALTAVDFSGLVIPLIDARRNHVYAGFYLDGNRQQADAYMSFETVLTIAQDWQGEVCFVGEVEGFRQQIEETMPTAKIKASLPSASLLGQLGQKMPALNTHDLVPNYLKRVEAEENWLKEHDDTDDHYIKWV
ncbi:tRNA (adenosine(37)-N6)-threonylcarbamoyltransferase complex dimerization subunit type 1 TsaB [Streptococcus sp. sy010]|uniref:tRNA (adenosine(37)-N6)-threonylcarbamoyltransferase complex dimerization subunit type 1 TsaB n=1 Tax=Streptococcus sp. sy010 TaxID=2600148 RepID=UPI0011B7F340|nr:tRNA (adenosine(37)-N6)-threonylcarbamoyltransferase complex dimerization subunit type 1 TsaB [Streptococcus sp. sy010]TWT16181.1 tRNA (adenosine(37)-N6)-threonylcarbamoyltransferase complex dimerization subunit type 1 TsaB [Streptococcus sp. sy010]